MPLDIECYDENSTCPKCGMAGASTDFAGGIPGYQPVMVRRCSLCGFTRVEKPVDHEDCHHGP